MVAADETDFIDPTAIGAGGRAAIFFVKPANGVRAGREFIAALLPIDLAGNAAERFVIDDELEKIEILFGGNFPPEEERAGTIDGGFEKGFGIIANGRAGGRVNAIVTDAA